MHFKCTFKKHDFDEKIFLKSMILKKKIFKRHDFEEKSLLKSMVLNLKIFFLSNFESKFFRLVRFYVNFFTTRQILNNLPKFTTCTFHIAFLHITMYSYKPIYLRQLDDSIRHRSNNTFCTLFRTDSHS